MQPKAYSYLRFSTPEQMKGDSFRRQATLAEDYARRHGLTLDTSLTFRDLGVSAFRGKNAETGKLGEFLLAVDDGLVPPGSFLLVESLDRISRQAARKALRVLEDVVERGVTVVTLNDGRAYDRDALDRDPMALLLALLTFIRANEESATKSRRLSAAWHGKRLKALEKPITAVVPAWITLDRDTHTLALIPERAAVVKRIFAMLADGVGQHRIAETLNREGVPTFGRSTAGPKARYWHRSYVKKIAENPATVGTYIPHIVAYENGKKARKPLDPMPGYFPAVVDEDTFNRVQAQRDTGRAPVSWVNGGAIQALLAGLARCPICDGAMTRVNKGKGNGSPRLVCAKAKTGAGCEYVSVPAPQVEDAILSNLDWLAHTMPSADDDLDAKLASAESDLNATEEAIRNIVEAIATGTASPALKTRLADLEASLDGQRRKVDALSLQAATATPAALTKRIDEAGDAARAPEKDTAKINALLRQCFKAVTVDYRDGRLRFHWKHGGASEVVFAWPRDEAA